MKASEGIGSEDDLVVVLYEEIEHVGYEDDECVGGAINERPGDGVLRLGGRGWLGAV